MTNWLREGAPGKFMRWRLGRCDATAPAVRDGVTSTELEGAYGSEHECIRATE